MANELHNLKPAEGATRKRKRVVATTTAALGAAGLATGTYALGRRHGRRGVLRDRGSRLPWR